MDHPIVENLMRTGEPYPMKPEKYVGKCEHCGEGIRDWEDRYEVGEVMLHEDCFFDWAREQYLVKV